MTLAQRYGKPDEPLKTYAGLMGLFGAAVSGAAALARSRGDELPERFAAGDVALVGLATHKLTRIIAKDRVTTPVRAPFTRYEEADGHGEVTEETRGTGIQKGVGELVLCPNCLGPWVAAGLMGGLVMAPRQTRALSATFAAVGLSDFLHLAYARLK